MEFFRVERGCLKGSVQRVFERGERLFEGISAERWLFERIGKEFLRMEKSGCLKESVGSFQSEERRHLNSPTEPSEQQSIYPCIIENVLVEEPKNWIISHQLASHCSRAPLEKVKAATHHQVVWKAG